MSLTLFSLLPFPPLMMFLSGDRKSIRRVLGIVDEVASDGDVIFMVE